MRFPLRSFAAACLAAIGVLTPAAARADWIFSFTQTSAWYGTPWGGGEFPGVGDPPWPLGPETINTVGSFRLADNFVRGSREIGLHTQYSHLNVSKGLVDIQFTSYYHGGWAVDGNMSLFTLPGSPYGMYYYDLDLKSSPGKLFPTGSMYINNQESDTHMTFAADGSVTGVFHTDRGGVCWTQGGCEFTGYLTATHVRNGNGNGNGPKALAAVAVAVAVPAPASLVLLGMGLAGLVAVRPRRARRSD
ncbi:PEP-CTERM sorting domain-containing protein [Sabulicella rubraurantiaca]|uniref:PEP-CTERM sorting domain-containing protein n=1 Tax=Sabulicella rubraurantiaca TaxID=2811429 RepID=UPI001A972A7A|nr:PEP-CTERM sorting domain-containing protein [Sabulicella rubraurantiaca]